MGIAQQPPLLLAVGYRLVFLAIALVIWMVGTVRHAVRYRTAPDAVA